MKAPAICSCKPSRKWSSANKKVSELFSQCVALIACAVALTTGPAHAYLSNSNYHVVTEPGTLLLDSYTHWDSEASSDYITYQRPFEWEGSWWRSTRAFDLTMGSISSKQFLNDQRLKLYAPLSESVEFRLHWLQERDFEQDRIAMPLELRFRLTPEIFMSILGQPSLYKAEDDVGVALAVRTTATTEFQLTGLWGDFQRNQRNLNSDRWSKAPVAWTFTATDLSGEGASDFTRFEVHYEPKSVRSLGTSPTRTLSYQSAYFSGLTTFGLGSSLGYRILADRASDVDHTNSTNRTRFRSLNQIEYATYGGPVRVRPGANFFYREIHLDAGREYYREILPTIWADFPETDKAWARTSWSLGYDATVFNRDSSERGDDRAIEHRLNVKWNMTFTKAGELSLLFTFDLDRFGSDETWEGGCGQFRLLF